jgi:6-phosphogluconolactonase
MKFAKFSLLTWAVSTALVFSSGTTFAQRDKMELVFVGSGHTNIDAFRLNLTTGMLTRVGAVAPLKDASFMAISPNRKFLYAITEGDAKDNSFVSAYRIDAETGNLTFLDQKLTGGSGPCFVTVDPKGKDVLVANYISGSASVFPIGPGGALGAMAGFVQDHGSSVNHYRQEGPHAHCVLTDPDGRFAFVCDLGLDKVMVFKFDPAKGTLTANDPPSASIKPGSGPRHIAFHPNRHYAYVINEMASTLTVFAYDRHRGALSELEEHALLPADFRRESHAAEVAVHPSGKFVFASNRGDDSIVVYRCDPATGLLTFVERDSSGGKTPRNFEIDSTGAFLLAGDQDADLVVVFRVDPATGHLQPAGSVVAADKPMCVKCLGLH